ncbi:MAG: CoA transferase [Rhizobiales bacterium]|nr:CoA transferase [Hyphomicrobiales bacterium]
MTVQDPQIHREPVAPLPPIRVIDLSRVLAGPYCAQLLADMGADVIKVEAPIGDENRQWGARHENGTTCNFYSVNRGKRGITLNLKSPEAKTILHGLVRKADVLIHSFLPETGAKLGVDYESLKAVKPDLIFCSVSGFGESGPLRNKPGYDLMMQAFAGVMSTTGFANGPPIRSGVSFIDMSTGMMLYGGILTALINRMRTSKGAWVHVSLLETAISLLGYHAVSWLQAGVLPTKEGSGIWHLCPYQAFPCKDGYLLAGATNDVAWRRFAVAIGRTDLDRDERFKTNDNRLKHRDILVGLLEEHFRTQDVAHWLDRFDAHGVAASPLHSLDQVLAHPQVAANNMIVNARTKDGRNVPGLGMPFKISTYSATSERAAPDVGADTNEVLSEVLGLSESEVQKLRDCGAI